MKNSRRIELMELLEDLIKDERQRVFIISSLISTNTNLDEDDIKNNLKLISEFLEVINDVSINNFEEEISLEYIKIKLETGQNILKNDLQQFAEIK